jgi:probable rRNA maturation factor
MSGITLLIEDSKWRSHRGLQMRLKNAADAARKAAKLKGGFTILLANDKRLRALNRDFRGKDKPTNVLSFPSVGVYRGDIAIAYGVTAAEAKAAGKSFADHAVHLAVHGVLHLAGYDHEVPKDAKIMEPLEVKILARLGIADPYASFKDAPQ